MVEAAKSIIAEYSFNNVLVFNQSSRMLSLGVLTCGIHSGVTRLSVEWWTSLGQLYVSKREPVWSNPYKDAITTKFGSNQLTLSASRGSYSRMAKIVSWEK